MTQFNGKHFGGRLFAGRLFRAPAEQLPDRPIGGAARARRVPGRRRRRDEEALLFVTLLKP